MKVRHILVQHKYEAEDLHKQILGGKKFEDIAKKFSTCSSASQGGDLGDVPVAKLDSDFAEALEVLKVQEISKPVRTRFGYHLIQRLS